MASTSLKSEQEVRKGFSRSVQYSTEGCVSICGSVKSKVTMMVINCLSPIALFSPLSLKVGNNTFYCQISTVY